jgi:cytosine/adenosine deaminase-related metal-dependent hydrolase
LHARATAGYVRAVSLVEIRRRALVVIALVAACGEDGGTADGTTGGGDASATTSFATTAASASTSTTTVADETSNGSTGAGSGGEATTGSGSDSGSTGGETDGETGMATVTECGTMLDPPAVGTCEVTQAGTVGLVLRGVVLGADEVLRGGEVLIDGAGIISCVDCDCSAMPGYADASVVTCANGAISPGLINPHDHLGYANNQPIGDGVDRYEHRHDWRIGKNGHEALPYNEATSNTAVRVAAELRFLMGGVTSTASTGDSPGLLRNLDTDPTALEGLPIQPSYTDTFPLDDSNGWQNDFGCDYGDDPTTSSDIDNWHAYSPHIAEGISDAAYNELVCTSTGDTDLIQPNTAIIHAIGIVPEQIELIAESHSRVIWSPRSNIVLYGNTAPVTVLDAMGVPIALGTDWMLSGSMDLQRELRCASDLDDTYFGDHFDARELWQMVTTNAALATGTELALGKLQPAYVADIAVFAMGDSVDHEAIVAELADVALVLRGGQALYGDADLLATPALGGASCEVLDVCGASKRACVAADTGYTLDAARAAIEAYYPLFFCGEPTDEPSCVPYRDEYPDGIVAGDMDGDGIGDALDLCPSVFDPVRWLEATQGDADADGAGDACDPCPLDSTDACNVVSADDVDDDGVLNGSDNCPLVANDQSDADADGHGDACDGCPLVNAGPSACALSIAAIRDPDHPDHPTEGTIVLVEDAIVTAVRSSGTGFYVQDDTLAPYTGIFVFTYDADVELGNRVTVRGVYDEFFGLGEIVAQSVVVTEATTTLPFDPIAFADPSELATGSPDAEGWESMLVEVGPVTITDFNPDAPNDYDELEVTGGLRVDDEVDQAMDNACPNGTNLTSVVGVLGYGFSDYKLLPRSPADVVAPGCSPFP